MFKHWTHSREEDSEGIKVYRPNEYNFPPSRGREGFELGVALPSGKEIQVLGESTSQEKG